MTELLGYKVKDKLTGLVGIADYYVEKMGGEKSTKPHAEVHTFIIDAIRVKMVKALKPIIPPIKTKSKSTGGPRERSQRY